MNNKEKNTNPADSGIVTKKGFLISPPKKIKGTAKLEFTSANQPKESEKKSDKPREIKKHQKHESFDHFEQSRKQEETSSNRHNRNRNRSRKPGHNNNTPETVQSAENRAPKQETPKNTGARPFKKGGKSSFGKNARDNQRKEEMYAEIERAELEHSKNRHGHKNSDRKNRDNHKNDVLSHNDNAFSKNEHNTPRKERSMGNESVLHDLGLVSDSFFKKSKTLEPLNNDEPEQVIDYSKAIPLREQIYPTKPVKEPEKPDGDGCEIIGVRFKEAGKIYYFDPDGKEVAYGTPVIVETARGMEYGYTAIGNRFVPVDNIVSPLKKIVRLATREDKERLDANKVLEKDAEQIFKDKTAKLGLEMELVGVEYTFDNTKLLFYFVAEGRVDFRELVKELAAVFHTRIELRQVGVRDQAKMLGGLGVCGRALCCKSFLGEFAQVSIKMAKDQNLSLNSAKISGTCGRLLCCLRYEDEVYQKEYERTPKVDAIVETPEGKGVVTEANPLKGTVRVLLESKSDTAPQTFHRDSVTIVGYAKKSDNTNDAELEALEKE